MSHRYYTHGVVWAVFVPFILLGLLLAFLVLFSYNRILRSLDVILLAFLPALALDTAGLVLVQAVIYLRDIGWGHVSCQVYTWAWIWLRLTEILLLLLLSLERVLFLHAWQYTHRGSWAIKLLVTCAWLVAGVIAAIPIIGWDGLDFTANIPEICNYMVYEIDHQYAIFVLVLEMTAAFLALGCLADTLIHLKNFAKHIDLTPRVTVNGIVTKNKPSDFWDRSVSATAAYDSCRLVCILLAVVFIVNHVPHAVSPFLSILTTC